jgi:hypothetical protein
VKQMTTTHKAGGVAHAPQWLRDHGEIAALLRW